MIGYQNDIGLTGQHLLGDTPESVVVSGNGHDKGCHVMQIGVALLPRSWLRIQSQEVA